MLDVKPSECDEKMTSRLPLVRRQLYASGLSQAALDIILHAWRDGTKKQYHTYVIKWESYCNSKGISPGSASICTSRH